MCLHKMNFISVILLLFILDVLSVKSITFDETKANTFCGKQNKCIYE